MKITVTNDKQSRHNQGEFTAAIHGHIDGLIKHPTETVFHAVNHAVFQSFTE